jgi:hypothetical protein
MAFSVFRFSHLNYSRYVQSHIRRICYRTRLETNALITVSYLSKGLSSMHFSVETVSRFIDCTEASSFVFVRVTFASGASFLYIPWCCCIHFADQLNVRNWLLCGSRSADELGLWD